MKQINALKNELNSVLDFTPIVFEGDPLLLAEYSNTRIEKDLWEYVRRVDHPDPILEQRTILLGPNSNYYDRWPVITTSEKTPLDLKHYNKCLFDCVIRSMPTSESGACRPVNPVDAVHRIRSMPSAFFGKTGMVDGMDRNQ